MHGDIGKLILRLMLGSMMLFHGFHKVAHGIGFIESSLNSHSLPEFLAYGVYVGEILAPIFLIIGWKSKFWAGIIGINMLVAIYLTQLGSFIKIGSHGAWAVETTMFYLFTAIAIVLFGSGKYAIMKD
jgi:putative oxidoreductase